MCGWKSDKGGNHFNNDKKKRDVGGHYEITETEVKSNFEPIYEDQDKFAEDVKRDFENKSDNELRNHIQNTSGNDDDQIHELKRRGRSWHWEGNKMIFDDETIKNNQKVMIKFPTEEPTLLLNDAVVYVDPILKFEGRLKDGRSVVHDRNDEWIYYV